MKLISIIFVASFLIAIRCDVTFSNTDNSTHCYYKNKTIYSISDAESISIPWETEDGNFKSIGYKISRIKVEKTCGEKTGKLSEKYETTRTIQKLSENLVSFFNNNDEDYKSNFELVDINIPNRFEYLSLSKTPSKEVLAGDLCAADSYAYTHYLDFEKKAFIQEWMHAYPIPKLLDALLEKEPLACGNPDDEDDE